MVNTDETASCLVDIMMHEKNGRVTSMPLNWLKPIVPHTLNAQDNPGHGQDLLRRQAPEGLLASLRQDLRVPRPHHRRRVRQVAWHPIMFDGDKVNRKLALTGIEAIRNVTS